MYDANFESTIFLFFKFFILFAMAFTAFILSDKYKKLRKMDLLFLKISRI